MTDGTVQDKTFDSGSRLTELVDELTSELWGTHFPGGCDAREWAIFIVSLKTMKPSVLKWVEEGRE